MNKPTLTISLDFELHWGVFDHTRLDEAGKNYFDRTRSLIPTTLNLFREYGINATWATVGMLMAKNKAQLLAYCPTVRPDYGKEALNAYRLLEDGVGESESDDPYHYAPSLVEDILNTPGQELGSHTFSHYYCLEPNRSEAAFRADLEATQRIAKANFGIGLRSLVFPRNQYPADYLTTIADCGYQTYRTNPDQWFWRAEAATAEPGYKKAVRLADHYLPISSPGNDAVLPAVSQPLPLPASRFYRPYIGKLDGYGGQELKLRRIRREMTAAAVRGEDYHLWWHPHNLATEPDKNMSGLRNILDHFAKLRDAHGMRSVTMADTLETR